jgi:hypothetical protein
MGAWGHGVFEDDSALDQLDEWVQADHPVDDMAALVLRVLTSTDVPYEDGIGVLVAAAVVEMVLSAPDVSAERVELEEDVEGLAAWLTTLGQNHIFELLPQVRLALPKVWSTDSELCQLWAENADDFPLWKAGAESRLARLAALGG